MYNNKYQTKPTKPEAKPLPTPRAFTLVELLTVVVIISMLAAMSMLALSGTMTAAKESKTRGTIAKLDVAILDIFESYQERFDSIEVNNAKVVGGHPALAKLHFISDIMRMEMPCKWDEVTHNAPDGPIPLANGYHVLQNASGYQIPPALKYYRDAHAKIIANPNSKAPQSSELLFLIIANLNPEALENFHGSEIGDIDGNGYREFHDAWGNPILFLRWAPAFTGSDLQPDVTAIGYPLLPADWVNPVGLSATNWDVSTTTLSSPQKELVANMNRAANQFSDPFDPNGDLKRTWFVYPLIISAGADGKFEDNELKGVDLRFDTDSPLPVKVMNQLQFLNSAQKPWGLPADTDHNGELNHYDNIHNHRSSNSF